MRPQITYYGHSCFSIQLGGKNILFDPFITPNPKASMVDVSTIKPDVILITHGHGDHIADVEAIAKQSNAQVIAAYEVTEWLSQKGVKNCLPMNTGGSINLGFCYVKMVKAEHSSSFPDGSYAGNAIGFVVNNSECCFYYAGDTSLTLDMQLIPLEFKLDFAFLPIGDNFTMGIDDAVKATKLINCKKVVGMHFDTFPPIEIDHKRALESFEKEGLSLILPIINQTIQL
ncbi:MAG: metal-dependent hydrolase [Bacteroidetes bacterium]|nr:MAG: metal-dependent hydrolase [Bacteroidota bacterium]